MSMDRRTFLRRGLTAAAGAAALGGPFQALVARAALADHPPAPNNGGYGPLIPVPDQRDGVVRLRLPEGFQYRSFGYTGEVLADGVATPGRHDGMAVFPGGPGRLRLVRNHEVNGPGAAFGSADRAYDPMTRGGTTTLEVSLRADTVTGWVSLNGTQMNCAGGPTPWGSWISAEETVNGPDVGPDFTGAPNTSLQQKHGYLFEVRSSWGPGEHPRVEPIRGAGRFAHEAVAIDPTTGYLYLTEDDFDFPSGFYRYRAPVDPRSVGELRDGGVLEMLAVTGEPDAALSTGRTVHASYPVHWVPIEDPDPTFPPGTTNTTALQAVSLQGRALGAATFSRLEGIAYADGKVYLVSTQGGDAPDGGPASGYGDGYGQVWVYDTATETITLLFESRDRTVMELPDNLTISPRGGLLLCEDGPVENFLRGLTPDGAIFDFAENAIAGRQGDEFAGATFSPGGRTLFVNIQASSGLTFAIWGPWTRGSL